MSNTFNGNKIRFTVTEDCCGFQGLLGTLTEWGTWNVWHETKHYKTERGAINGAKRFLKCYGLELA